MAVNITTEATLWAVKSGKFKKSLKSGYLKDVRACYLGVYLGKWSLFSGLIVMLSFRYWWMFLFSL